MREKTPTGSNNHASTEKSVKKKKWRKFLRSFLHFLYLCQKFGEVKKLVL